jgi:hypothetical protein
MKFIRDIIADKTQVPGQDAGADLSYPLRLTELERTDSPAPVPRELDTEAEAQPPQQPAAPELTAVQARRLAEQTHVDLSAISDALATEPSPAPMPEPAPAPAPPAMDLVDAFALRAGGNPKSEALASKPETVEEPPQPIVEEASAPQEEPIAAVPRPAPEAAPVAVTPKRAPVQSRATEMPPAETPPEPATPEVDLDILQASVRTQKSANSRGAKGRVKTRLLGFSAPSSQAHDPLSPAAQPSASTQAHFPVGWLVVVAGPGKGASFSLFDGLTQIGRGEGQTVRLDFGDNTISRDNHAAIAFDAEQRRFFFGHGGKANLVRLNGQPVLSTETLPPNSIIRIGETTLRFVALCGEDFIWNHTETEVASVG